MRLAFDRCKLLARLVADKDVLDLGCVNHDLSTRRRGHWLHDHLKHSARSIVGVDYEEDGIEAMRQEGYDVVCADVAELNLERAFDVVVAGEILEHIPDKGAFLAACARHLLPDGRLLLTTPNANCLIYFLENLILGREIDNDDHVCLFSPTTLRTLLGKCGFEAERFIFLAEPTMYCHAGYAAKALVLVKQFLQVTLGFLRPSLCHHVVTIAARKAP